VEEQVSEDADERFDAPSEISPKEAVARFYFSTLNLLAKDDVTKYKKVLSVKLYLCLNALSAHKERVEKENELMKKEQQQWKSMSRSRR
jgi:hypothetical protein